VPERDFEQGPERHHRRAVPAEERHGSPHDVAVTHRRAATFGPPPRRHRDTGGLQGFVRRYGWRAYALPILVVVTVAALVSAGGNGRDRATAEPGQPAASSPPVATGSTSIKADRPGAGARTKAIEAAALPAGKEYTSRGTGHFQVIPGTTNPIGRGQAYRYSVEVEGGVHGVDTAAYAQLVDSSLADRRSWAGHGDVRLQRVDSGPVDFRVSLVSPMTVRELCGYDIPVETSCYIPAGGASPVNRVVLNLARWVRGDAAYLGDLEAYRIYMVNHEVGHALGHQHSHSCLPGGLAPIMMQQTLGLRSAKTGQMCQANPWPYPPGVQGAPGKEEADTPQNSEFVLTGD
jgi:hypothetical protein